MNTQAHISTTSQEEPNQFDRPNKKGYHRPRLSAYGDIQEITRAVGDNGKNDGGSVANMMMSQLP